MISDMKVYLTLKQIVFEKIVPFGEELNVKFLNMYVEMAKAIMNEK